jgi:LacI family transcriptional regulator
MLNSSQAVCAATVTHTSVQAEARKDQGGRRRLIAVGMNFQPRQLRTSGGRSLRHVYFDDVLFGIRARADAGNADLLLLTEMSSRVTGTPSHFSEICARHAVDGIVLVAFEPEDSELVSAAESGLPCVAIDSHLIGAHATFVTSDNVGGAVAAVRHLGKMGRKRIAFVGGVAETVASSNRRLGYESGLEELGLEAREEYVLETDWLPATALAKVRTLLEADEPPDAIFCVSDELALGAMQAIEESGRRVPEDIAVIGFDDADFAGVVTPSLTSVRQDCIGLGTAAVEMLLRMLENPDASLPVSVLPVDLIARESSSQREPASAKPAERTGTPTDTRLALRLSIGDALSMLTAGVEPEQDMSSPDSRGEASGQTGERPLVAVALGIMPQQSFPRGFFHGVFLSIRAQAHAHATDLVVLPRIDTLRDLSHTAFVDHYRALGVAAIVVLSQPQSERELLALAEAGFPCVTVGIDLLGDRVACVMSDNVDGATKAVSHLAASGRKRIAFVAGRSDTRATIDRRFGYQSELERLGLEYREEYVALAHWLPEVAREQMTLMLSLPEPPDAVLCGSDVMAIGAMAAIEEAGLRIPEDVAVVGFDDIEYASLVSPSLTTVRQDAAKIAEAVLKSILHLLDRPDEPPPVFVLPVELVVRESAPGAGEY